MKYEKSKYKIIVIQLNVDDESSFYICALNSSTSFNWNKIN